MNEKLVGTHEEAARLLCEIKNEFRNLLLSSGKISEKDARKFVKSRFRRYNLRTDKDSPIIAFRENTSSVHHLTDNGMMRLRQESLIMLDMWAHLPHGVYADMTWMFYYGKRPSHMVLDAFDAIVGARDSMISFLRNSLQDGVFPTSNRCDAAVRDHLNKKGYGAYFLHSSGHSMTQRLVHGLKSNKGLSPRNPSRIRKMLPYTIEPGLYFAHLDEPFGVRTEMDFYIGLGNKVVLTTEQQKGLDFILPKGQRRLDRFSP
ncbi:MAG: M24 family metallopeptidase [Candidatus Woesearchaeota archaeon]